MISVVEDFLSEEYQDYIYGLIKEMEIPLYLYERTYTQTPLSFGISDPNTKENYQLSHMLIRDGKATSNLWATFSPITTYLMAKTGVGYKMELDRAKINLNPRMPFYKDNEYFTPHIDVPLGEKGITAIYYMNDADGDTLFFETPKKHNKGESLLEVQEELKVIKRISPKKGTIVYFDNQIFHSGTPPQKSFYRSVINFNWRK
jgi:hypothetical protein